MKRNCSNKDDESNLLSNFISGDPKAARMFFEKYGGIIKYAVNKVDIKSNVIDREDLFQEAIVYILKDNMKVIRDFKGKCKFSVYLYIICRRYAIRYQGKERSMLYLEETPPLLIRPPSALIEALDKDQESALIQAIGQLDENEQIFIHMKFYENRSTSEIMNFFGFNQNKVYKTNHNIIKDLKEIMSEILGDYSDV